MPGICYSCQSLKNIFMIIQFLFDHILKVNKMFKLFFNFYFLEHEFLGIYKFLYLFIKI